MRMKRLAGILLVGAAWVSLACLMVVSNDAMGGGSQTDLRVPDLIRLGKVPDTVAVAAIAPGEIDTSQTISTWPCARIALSAVYDGDSAAYWIDWSPDGSTWDNLVDSSFVNAAPGTVAINVWKQLAQAATASIDTAATYGDWILPNVRVRIHNLDVIDTMKTNTWTIWCVE